MRRKKRDGLEGQVLVTFVAALLVLVAFAGLAVDSIGAWRVGQMQLDALQSVKETVMNAQEAIKFGAGHTGDNASVDALESVIREHFGNMKTTSAVGKLEVQAYELPESQSGLADRYIGVRISTDGTYKTTIASAVGLVKIPVKNELVFLVHPYSSRQVWRPTSGAASMSSSYQWRNGVLEGGITAHSLDWASLDQDLKDLLTSATGS